MSDVLKTDYCLYPTLCGPGSDCSPCDAAAIKAYRAEIESLRAQLAEKGREYRELSNAWDEMRDVVLHGIDQFDNDQTNAVLSVIDDYDPRALENDDG